MIWYTIFLDLNPGFLGRKPNHYSKPVFYTMYSYKLYIYFTDGAIACGLHVSTGETNKVPLLPSQPTHLPTSRMRYTAGKYY